MNVDIDKMRQDLSKLQTECQTKFAGLEVEVDERLRSIESGYIAKSRASQSHTDGRFKILES